MSFAPHDHDACRTAALEHARAVCAERGLRLTDTREAVLRILLESHRAISAYDILDRLATADGRAPKPPVAYRALAFLTEHGFAHRIERLNAFVACARPGCAHDAGFMICRQCRKVAEVDAAGAAAALGAAGAAHRFAAETAVIEIEGLCPACDADDAAS